MDLIWLCAEAEDRLEHVRVLDSPLGCYVVWFLLSPDEESAHATAIAVSRRVIAATPLLAGWSVAS